MAASFAAGIATDFLDEGTSAPPAQTICKNTISGMFRTYVWNHCIWGLSLVNVLISSIVGSTRALFYYCIIVLLRRQVQDETKHVLSAKRLRDLSDLFRESAPKVLPASDSGDVSGMGDGENEFY
jgi:hypothetical protein